MGWPGGSTNPSTVKCSSGYLRQEMPILTPCAWRIVAVRHVRPVYRPCNASSPIVSAIETRRVPCVPASGVARRHESARVVRDEAVMRRAWYGKTLPLC